MHSQPRFQSGSLQFRDIHGASGRQFLAIVLGAEDVARNIWYFEILLASGEARRDVSGIDILDIRERKIDGAANRDYDQPPICSLAIITLLSPWLHWSYFSSRGHSNLSYTHVHYFLYQKLEWRHLCMIF